MSKAPHGPLGEALDAWIDDQRVSIAHIMRVSGVARNTIKLIIIGTSRHPKPETLEKLARAIATHPRRLSLDISVYERCQHDLRVLAGYQGAVLDGDDTLLGFAVLRAVGDPERARAWLALLAEYGGLEAADVLALGSGRAIQRRARPRQAPV